MKTTLPISHYPKAKKSQQLQETPLAIWKTLPKQMRQQITAQFAMLIQQLRQAKIKEDYNEK